MTQTADLQRIRARVEIGAPPERVHRALTDELERWLADAAGVDLSAGRYDFWGPHVFEAPDRDAGRIRSSSTTQAGSCASGGASAAPTPRSQSRSSPPVRGRGSR